MLVTGIKSMPVYGPLQFDDSGTMHLIVSHGVGGEVAARLVADAAYAKRLDTCRVLYVSAGADDLSADLLRVFPGTRVCADAGDLLRTLDAELSAVGMGVRLYAAGSEEMLSRIVQAAERHGFDPEEVQCEQAGPGMRRVYCIHCRTCNEGVTSAEVPCGGCGRNLLVRDHYSRRHAAFMGVMADAEVQVAA